MKPFIIRGAVAGAIGSLAMALTLLLLGEPSISDAIALEQKAAGATAHHDELFSRSVQVIGGSLGVILYGVLVGTIFGIVYAATRHWLGTGAQWRKAFRLAGLGFVTLALVPFLKYPANPPAVGDPETVNQRTIAYLVLIALAVVVTIVAIRLAAHLSTRGWPDHLRLPVAVGLWVLAIGVAFAALPGNPDPITVGAKLIWRFRLATLGGHAGFWAVTGVAFGWLTMAYAGEKVFGPALDESSVSHGG